MLFRKHDRRSWLRWQPHIMLASSTRSAASGGCVSGISTAILIAVTATSALAFQTTVSEDETKSAILNSCSCEGSADTAVHRHLLKKDAAKDLKPRQAIGPDSPTTSNASNKSKLLFLGTGSSTGCPRPLCALLFPPHNDSSHHDRNLAALQKEYESSCKVSRLAAQGDPKYNKNYRNNPSILISHFNQDDNEDKHENDNNSYSSGQQSSPQQRRRRNVIIDVGKTFREGALRWLPQHNIHSIDAILLTHEHMDAVGGLDDVRGFQKRRHYTSSDAIGRVLHGLEPIAVFLTRTTLHAIRKQFHYLVPKVDNEDDGEDINKRADDTPKVKRLVAALEFQTIEDFTPFVAGGLRFTPLPVMHGEDMICTGFAFSIERTTGANAYSQPAENADRTAHESPSVTPQTVNVLYLSDISRMLPETEHYIVNHLPPTDILVIDSLLVEGHNPTHVSMREAIEMAKRLGPDKVYLLGMNCDDFLPHEEMNKLLSQKDENGLLDVQLAFDGLVLEF